MDLAKQHDNKPLLKGPLCLSVTFYMPMPDKWSLSKKERMVGKCHKYKPVLSNLLKYVEDCANQVIFEDDIEISIISAKKVYDWFTRTEFEVTTEMP